MINATQSAGKLRLLLTAAPFALLIGATPAFAQVAATPAASPAVDPTSDEAANDKDIVVTGTLFRRTTSATPSPVYTIKAEDLERRGINTVAEAVQRLSANGSGTLPNSFSANGAFASGASAPSLRGLTTDSTLILFDGLRAAYYPLADDGTRNFVDINSIPTGIVDRIDVLKDGASSTYGADAVAGVINVITKKQITGLHLNASSGISQKGDSAEERFDATAGYGDLADKGFNIYVSGEYQHNAPLYSADRGYPYNTSDLSKLCGTSVGTATVQAGTTTCRTNGIYNGIQFDGTYAGLSATTVAVVRPYNATPVTGLTAAGLPVTYGANAVALGSFQLLNGGLGCSTLNPINLTTAQRGTATNTLLTGGTSGYAGATYGATQCQEDPRNLYSQISPEQTRVGGSARLTVRLTDTLQAYAAFNFYQSKVFYTGAPSLIRSATPAGGVVGTLANITLPIYNCNRNGANVGYNSTTGVTSLATACTAANGTLNPNNPYAASGQLARLFYQFGDLPISNERLTNSFRGAGGITGTIGDGFNVSLEGTYMKQKLRATYKGYPIFQNVLNSVYDGSYNFSNPALNTQAVRDYIAPTRVNRSTSDLGQVQLTIAKDLFSLPGGPLQVAVGGAFRHESVTAPSANAVDATNPYNRYYTINGFGTSGSRDVKSGFFEINAPIFSFLEVNGSGRYDSYSSGQSNFSPKIGAKFTPFKMLALRATYSKGFRIPSFAESFGLPTTGYITVTPPAAYQNSPACNIPGGTAKYAYCTAQYSLGLTSVGNPNLQPEKATNFTAGVIIEPSRHLSFSIDYYNIYKKNLITGADYAPQVAAYYASATAPGTALTNGVTGITVDPSYTAANGGPYALLSTVQYGFINADSAKSTGIDFGIEGSLNITPSIKWISSLDANYVIELSQTIGGVKQNYVDSLGAYQTTAASGTPQWKGSWQNTLDFGTAALTSTINYVAGYSEGAADAGNTPDGLTCGATAGSFGSFAVYRDGATIVQCRVNSFISVDLTGSVKVNDKFSLYVNILNALNAKPPYDPSTYGAYQYNPANANAGIIGRYFRVGAKVNF